MNERNSIIRDVYVEPVRLALVGLKVDGLIANESIRVCFSIDDAEVGTFEFEADLILADND